MGGFISLIICFFFVWQIEKTGDMFSTDGFVVGKSSFHHFQVCFIFFSNQILIRSAIVWSSEELYVAGECTFECYWFSLLGKNERKEMKMNFFSYHFEVFSLPCSHYFLDTNGVFISIQKERMKTSFAKVISQKR